MKIEIPDDIIQKATKCKKTFSCLSENDGNFCKILCYLKDDFYFVKCLDNQDCPYVNSYGKVALCTCPVRKEIYRRYKK